MFYDEDPDLKIHLLTGEELFTKNTNSYSMGAGVYHSLLSSKIEKLFKQNRMRPDYCKALSDVMAKMTEVEHRIIEEI